MYKVAVIVDTWFPFIGGGQINALEISKRIVRDNDFKVDIITRNNGKNDLKLPKNLKQIRLGPYSKPANQILKLIFLIYAIIYIYKRNYDLVHAHAFLPGIAAKILSISKKTPTVFTVHGTSIGTNLTNQFQEQIEKIILTKIKYDSQISVSRDFMKLKNVNRNIIYIPNGINLKDFDNLKAVKEKLPTLIFVGRLHPQKNIITLLSAYKLVKNKVPSIMLNIVGNGPQLKEIKNKIDDLNLEGSINLMKSKKGNELIKQYKRSTLFILPSIYEGQPLTLLEAWAAKLPVIVTKTGDCQFLVKEGLNGFFIKNPRSPSQIADSIYNALKNKNLKKIGERGYALVRDNFSWDKSARETLKIYRKLL